MNILILGSEGFIGTNCVEYFINAGNVVFGIDLLNQSSLNYHYYKLTPEGSYESFFAENSFDACVNAAGNGNVSLSIVSPFKDYDANCTDVIKVLECIRKYNPECRLLHISSAAVYGNPAKLPVEETDLCNPLSPYGWHKMISEQICKEYHVLYNTNVCCIRPFSVYGAGLKKQIFWDIYQNTLKSKNVELWGTGMESRDFIYITDLVNVIGLLVEQARMVGEVYNVGTGTESFIKEVSESFCMEIDPNIKVSFNNKVRIGDPLNWKADISRISAYGFKQKVSLNEGISYLTKWLKEESRN